MDLDEVVEVGCDKDKTSLITTPSCGLVEESEMKLCEDDILQRGGATISERDV